MVGHSAGSTPKASSQKGGLPRRLTKQTIGSLVKELLMDEAIGYEAIVERVVSAFPNAKTSARSVASVAAVMRKGGLEVPMRRKTKN